MSPLQIRMVLGLGKAIGFQLSMENVWRIRNSDYLEEGWASRFVTKRTWLKCGEQPEWEILTGYGKKNRWGSHKFKWWVHNHVTNHVKMLFFSFSFHIWSPGKQTMCVILNSGINWEVMTGHSVRFKTGLIYEYSHLHLILSIMPPPLYNGEMNLIVYMLQRSSIITSASLRILHILTDCILLCPLNKCWLHPV